MIKIKHLIFTKKAEQDLQLLYNFIRENDSRSAALKIYTSIKEKCLKLKQFPQIGHIPPELERLSISTYLEINYKPYRIIYSISEARIIVFCIFNRRRNMMDILTKRLLI